MFRFPKYIATSNKVEIVRIIYFKCYKQTKNISDHWIKHWRDSNHFENLIKDIPAIYIYQFVLKLAEVPTIDRQ